jgi:polyphosphate kinase
VTAVEALERRTRYLNRELSTLDFNERVLALAADRQVPLLERVRFLAIVSSNLDEFFMVRVAGLRSQLQVAGVRSPDGRTPAETLAAIHERVLQLTERQQQLWLDELHPALATEGIEISAVEELDEQDLRLLEQRFCDEILPILTPLAVGPGQPFPYISGLSLSLGLFARHPRTGEHRLARVKVPESLARFLPLGGDGRLVPVEQVIARFLPLLYSAVELAGCAVFRVTRNADFTISDDADDLLEAVEAKLRRRRFGDVVRLEIAAAATEDLVERIQHGVGVGPAATYRVEGPLDLSELSQLASLPRPELRYPRWQPVEPPRLRGEAEQMFREIRRCPVLVQHPYDSFAASVEKFLEAAAGDDAVQALKTTVYRTNERSPLAPALAGAAEAGKQAVCLVELKARFDESHNIEWSRVLEQAGVHVVYGFPNLKVHAKTTLIVRRDQDDLRRYAHIGTGNYHALTAGLYEDFGLFTADPAITADVADLFNYMTGFGDPPRFRKLVVAPWGLRSRILAEIGRVAAAAEEGRAAQIQLKLNALTDEAIVDALYDASRAGARVEVVARSVCALRPGVEGMSENVSVTSVLGRFLEHSRFYIFDADGDTAMLLGSGDLMPRNLDHRIEVVTPIEDEHAQRQLRRVFHKLVGDSRTAWSLEADGTWQRKTPRGHRSPVSSQRAFMRRAVRHARATAQAH